MNDSFLLEPPFKHTATQSLFGSLVKLVQSAARALAENSVVYYDQVQTDRRFQQLVAEWKGESLFMSSVTDMVNLPSYQAIIGMRKQAIPRLLGELAREPNHWFPALSTITGADPVPVEGRGNLEKMTAAWLRWGNDQGYHW